MNVLYIGSGFVGVCSAAVTAENGHQTLVYDIDENKISKFNSFNREEIQSCLWEEGLDDLLIKNRDHIAFTSDYGPVANFLDDCDAVFMCLPTPEVGETGESNLEYYRQAAVKLAENLKNRNQGNQTKYVVIINKSTVPIDMVDQTDKLFKNVGVINFGIVSNPEFLVEGKAIAGSAHPDRVVVGAWDEKDFAVMRKLYERFVASTQVKYIEVNPKEAAAGKLLANFTLFNKLAICFDVVGRTCETFTDLEFENLKKILISDPRIGSWGYFDSLYAGGSCLIKDARSLSHQLQAAGQEAVLVNEIYLANKRQLAGFLSRLKKEAGLDWRDKKVALLGLSFKKDTNDIRNSASIDIVKYLQEQAVTEIKCFDPAAAHWFKTIFPESDQIKYLNNETEAMTGVDIIIISTDWAQFRGLADKLITSSERPIIMDGRRMLAHQYINLQNNGFNIIAVGSPFIKGLLTKDSNLI